MTEQEYKTALVQYTDVNGLIKPQASWNDSGNGIYFSAIANMVAVMNDWEQPLDYTNLVQSCMPTKGLLQRNPEDTYGQEQTDDYLGVILGCILARNNGPLKDILWYGVKHFFVFNNDGKLEFKDWLGRFVQVWVLMTAAAFPWIKYLFYPVLYLTRIFFHPVKNDDSGNILQFVFLYSLEQLYNIDFTSGWLLEMEPDTMKTTFSRYFSPEHPLTLAVNL